MGYNADAIIGARIHPKIYVAMGLFRPAFFTIKPC